MNNATDNVFELGLLYQTICDLKAIRDKISSKKLICKDVDRLIVKLKKCLVDEVNKL